MERPVPGERQPSFNPALHFESGVSSHNTPTYTLLIQNVCPCVGLICDDAPLWKCTAGLKLGGSSRGTGRSMELFLSDISTKWTKCDPAITKPTKSRIAKFYATAKNRWSGSTWVVFRFWYILKEQSFFYIILKFGSEKKKLQVVVFAVFLGQHLSGLIFVAIIAGVLS